MKDDAVIKDNEAIYLINEQTYLHLRENIEGIGYEVFEKESPLPVEEGQIPREILGDSQRRIGFRELSGFQDKQERSSVLSQLKAKCDMPECNPTKCRKGRNDHAI